MANACQAAAGCRCSLRGCARCTCCHLCRAVAVDFAERRARSGVGCHLPPALVALVPCRPHGPHRHAAGGAWTQTCASAVALRVNLHLTACEAWSQRKRHCSRGESSPHSQCDQKLQSGAPANVSRCVMQYCQMFFSNGTLFVISSTACRASYAVSYDKHTH